MEHYRPAKNNVNNFIPGPGLFFWRFIASLPGIKLPDFS